MKISKNKIWFSLAGVFAVTILLYLLFGFMHPVSVTTQRMGKSELYRVHINFSGMGAYAYAGSQGSCFPLYIAAHNLGTNTGGVVLGRNESVEFEKSVNLRFVVKHKESNLKIMQIDRDGYMRTWIATDADQFDVYTVNDYTLNQELFCVLVVRVTYQSTTEWHSIFISLGEPGIKEERMLGEDVLKTFSDCSE